MSNIVSNYLIEEMQELCVGEIEFWNKLNEKVSAPPEKTCEDLYKIWRCHFAENTELTRKLIIVKTMIDKIEEVMKE